MKMMRMMRILSVASAMLFMAVNALAGGSAASDIKVKVMSYNIRFSHDETEGHEWSVRKDAVCALVNYQHPDVFGAQEAVMQTQIPDIVAGTGYSWIGKANNGGTTGETEPVFYDEDKLSLGSSGTFWLSETPDMPGSMSFGATYWRTATWGIFTYKATGDKFFFLCAHLYAAGAPGQIVRTSQMSVILEQVDMMNTEGQPPILFAVFYLVEDSEGFDELYAAGYKSARSEAANSTDTGPTTNGWGTGGACIDHIFYKGPIIPWTFGVDRSGYESTEYPSDHWPVYCYFSFD